MVCQQREKSTDENTSLVNKKWDNGLKNSIIQSLDDFPEGLDLIPDTRHFSDNDKQATVSYA